MKKKPLPKEYFMEYLLFIANMGKNQNYDGYNPKSAQAMQTLVDSIVGMACMALEGRPLYVGSHKNGKDKPIWKPMMVTKDWKKVYPRE